MQIELVSQPDAVIAHWQELVDDPELARWPGRVETDEGNLSFTFLDSYQLSSGGRYPWMTTAVSMERYCRWWQDG
jgi:hypothetical protein